METEVYTLLYLLLQEKVGGKLYDRISILADAATSMHHSGVRNFSTVNFLFARNIRIPRIQVWGS
jgi:hypothetical protein